jgi:hypothetical protein
MTEFQKFEYQCRLVGLTFQEFCEASELYPADARMLLESNGGITEMINRLAAIRCESITVGDVVDVLRAKGISCTVSPTNLKWQDSTGINQGVRIDCAHEQRQEVLGRVLMALEEGEFLRH